LIFVIVLMLDWDFSLRSCIVRVALTSLMSELVNATIKYVIAPLEVGPEFAPI
jgi:hypothetical protein